MKTIREMKIDYINKHYREHRGVLIKKYRSIFGKYVWVIDENGVESKVYVGKSMHGYIKLGSKLTVGVIDRKLINIRPGICKNID